MLLRPTRIVFLLVAAYGLYLLHEFLFSSSTESPTGPRGPHFHIPPSRLSIQYPFKKNGIGKDEAKAEAVKKVMERTWRLYKEKAWGADEIRPVSGERKNTRNGWGASIVDSMTTAAVMGLTDVFADQYDWVVNQVDFSHAEGLVDPFETTIRYVGALVSAVDLLEAKVIKAPSKSYRKDILHQAQILADKLGPAFDTPTGMMWPRVNFEENKGVDSDGGRKESTSVHLARAGSHWLEYSTLSHLTGNPIYLKNSTKAWDWLVYNRKEETWPGIIESPKSIWTGASMGNTRTLGAPDDSHYEYLIKAHLLWPNKYSTKHHAKRWVQAMESAHKHLASKSAKTSPSNIFLLSFSRHRYENYMGHLACFAGGNLLLGAKYLSRPDLFEFGEGIIAGCRYAYDATDSQIGPETWGWEPDEPKEGTADFQKPVTAPQKDFFKAKGIWPTNVNYPLRPEVVESYFYGWRITGEQKYRDWAWDAFNAIVKASEAEWGYSEVSDVTRLRIDKTDNLSNSCESFWSAETLMYLYLIFAEPELCSLDEWVFNTEAHPLRRRL
ncbi:hypothetical protein TWF694_002827 [Orbilia ellipsospora]|uniref:alpha-1,2-Mannosidase n=1 Tax=Orbilia ellipsospora TaxID=2528407 RepID=A0AAV9X252_9PEZI